MRVVEPGESEGFPRMTILPEFLDEGNREAREPLACDGGELSGRLLMAKPFPGLFTKLCHKVNKRMLFNCRRHCIYSICTCLNSQYKSKGKTVEPIAGPPSSIPNLSQDMRCSSIIHAAALLVYSQEFATRLTSVRAVDLKACAERIGTWGPPLQNYTTGDSVLTLNTTYETCLQQCGAGMGDIDWVHLSENFGAWFLPWISLMFQIPFGAEQPLDDVVSFLVTIGSPALAAYSLQITHLNKYWIHKAFLGIRYPNNKLIPTALAAFHHIPIRIELSPPFLHSLIVLPKNDIFWSHLAAANKTRRWSIPIVVSYVLVIFSVILSTIDAIIQRSGTSSYSITAVWTFLLPIVVGWLYVGCEPEPSHLRNSLAIANQHAWVATEDRDRPMEMTNPVAIEFAEVDSVGLSRADELKPVPVFNYSRAFITPMTAEVVLRMMKNAAANARQKIPVDNSIPGGGISVWVESDNGEIRPENRVGSAVEVVGYCGRALQNPKWNSDPGTPLGPQPPEVTTTAYSPLHPQSPETAVTAYPPFDYGLISPSRWAPGIWKRVTIASILALGLQWGTAGAAVLVQYSSPPIGFGCRSLTFLLYGLAGTLSFFLFLASSILAHMSHPLPGQVPTRSRSRTYQNAGAVICRWLGKCLAIASGIGILLVCSFQVTGAFHNCFCESTFFDRGRHHVFRQWPRSNSDRNDTHAIWFRTGALAIAFVTSVLFGFSMYIGLPPRRHE